MNTSTAFRRPKTAMLILRLILCAATAMITLRATTLLQTFQDAGAKRVGGGQQGYSVAADGALTVTGAPFETVGTSANSGVVRIYDSATGALLYKLPNPASSSNDRFGTSVAVSGTRVVVGAAGHNTGTGIAYVYDLGGTNVTVPLRTLTNPAPQADDGFGSAVAISGDRVVIGASSDDNGSINLGSAYLYDLASGTPTVPVLTLNNPEPAAYDQFGNALAIEGTRLVVGAYGDSATVGNEGRAYVYDLAATNPAVAAHILPNPNPVGNDQFGISVALSGSRVVIGAYGKDTGTIDAGSAFVYELDGPTPAQLVHTLINPTPALSDQFGFAVAISGTWVAISAPNDDTPATDAGNVYLYDLSGATPTVAVKTAENPAPAADDRFGRSLAMSGDRLVVGASLDDREAVDSGSAFVYDVTGSTPLSSLAILEDSALATGNFFGGSVAFEGGRVVIGASFDDMSATNSGAAYVFGLTDGAAAVPEFVLSNPSPEADDFFGSVVAISGDSVLVSAPFDDAGAPNAGSVYVYNLAGTTPTSPYLTLTNPVPVDGDLFGRSVALAGSLVAVGAPYADSGATSAGRVYIYDLTNATPSVPVHILDNPDPEADDRFGCFVAISGTRVVVGAMGDNTGASDAGAAYVYDLASGTSPLMKLSNPSPNSGDAFGDALAIDGTWVAVGTRYDDTAGEDTGSVYVYDLLAISPAVPAFVLGNPHAGTSDRFGGALSVSGSRLLVGVAEDNVAAENDGHAYLYNLTSPTPTIPVQRIYNPAASQSDWFGYAVALRGTNAVVGSPYEDYSGIDRGAAYVFSLTEDDAAPMGGTMAVAPAQLVKAGTVLTATFAGWTDASGPTSHAILTNGTYILGSHPDTVRDFTLAEGTNFVVGRIVDTLGHYTDTAPVRIVVDGTAPAITSPTGIVARADSPAGAVVNFTFSVTDRDPDPAVAVSHPAGSTFPVGSTVVTVSARDDVGNGRTNSFIVRVWDPAAPGAVLQPSTLRNTLVDPGTNILMSSTFQGSAVAMDGGLAVLGAPGDDTGASDAGVVKIYDTGTGELLHVLANPNPVAADQFGLSVAVRGSMVLVGAPFADDLVGNAGKAYLYDLEGASPTVPLMTFLSPQPSAAGRFGTSLSISGRRVAIGAPYAATNCVAYVYNLDDPTPLVPVLTLTNPAPARSGQIPDFGASVFIDGSRLVVGAPRSRTAITNYVEGIAYVYDLDGTAPETAVFQLNNPLTATGDEFGTSVAVSGSRVVIGAPSEDTGASNAGSAYVYDLDGMSPTVPLHAIHNPAPVSSDNFGRSVAVGGDRVVIGTPLDDAPSSNSGTVYIYDMAGASPTVATSTFLTPKPSTTGRFGWSVAIAGSRLLVGAPNNDILNTDDGAGYLYSLTNASPGQPVFAFASPTVVTTFSTDEQFGGSVALKGSVLAVGAPFDNSYGSDSGSVYVYSVGSDGGAVPWLTLRNPAPGFGDNFGRAVGLGERYLVAGAPGFDGVTNNGGAAYVYDLAGGTPTQPVLTLLNPNPTSGAQFGLSVATDGPWVAVGAPFSNSDGTAVGRTYVYNLTNANPSVPVLTLSIPTPVSSANFGNGVAISGTRLVVGAYGLDTGLVNEGRAYVYDLASGTPAVPVATLINPSPTTEDQFGGAVAIDGPLVVVGTRLDDAAATDGGTVYVYNLTNGAPTEPFVILTNPFPSNLDQLGNAVAISGSRVAVGVYGFDAGAVDAGGVFVYDVLSATPGVPVARLTNPSFATSDQMGTSVAISGFIVAAGAPLDDANGADRGAVHLFGPALSDLPSAIDDVVWRSPGRTIKIPFATLLTNDVFPFGFPGAVTAVDTLSSNGVSIVPVEGGVLYQASRYFNGDDLFTYAISDGTATVRGTVQIRVSEAPDTVTQNFISSGLDGDGVLIMNVAGIPGREYVLQSTGDLTPPVSWYTIPVSRQTAPANGVMQFSNFSVAPVIFYRVIERQP